MTVIVIGSRFSAIIKAPATLTEVTAATRAEAPIDCLLVVCWESKRLLQMAPGAEGDPGGARLCSQTL